MSKKGNDPLFIKFTPVDLTPNPRDSEVLFDRIPKTDGRGDRVIIPPMPKSLSSPMKPGDIPQKPSPKKFVTGNSKN